MSLAGHPRFLLTFNKFLKQALAGDPSHNGFQLPDATAESLVHFSFFFLFLFWMSV